MKRACETMLDVREAAFDDDGSSVAREGAAGAVRSPLGGLGGPAPRSGEPRCPRNGW